MGVYARQGLPVYAWRFAVDPLHEMPLALVEQQPEPLNPFMTQILVQTAHRRESLAPGDGVYWQRAQPFSVCRAQDWGTEFLPIETLFQPLHPDIHVSVVIITLTPTTARVRKSYIYEPTGGRSMFLAKYALRDDGAWVHWKEGTALPEACELRCFYTEQGRPEKDDSDFRRTQGWLL